MGVFHGGDAATTAVELQTFSKLVKHFFIFTLREKNDLSIEKKKNLLYFEKDACTTSL